MYTKVNLKSIAQDLGLSVGTVSRILNGKAKQYRIGQKTVDLVTEYASKASYSPNLIAKSLQSSQTQTIGLVIPDIANPFFAQMAQQIEQVASIEDFSIILVDSGEQIAKEKKQLKNLLSRSIDGIIVAPVGTEFTHFSEIQQRKIPLIFVDRYDKNGSIPYISSENFQAGFEATQYLIEQGHRRIAIIKGDEAINSVQERHEGYKAALKKYHIPLDPRLQTGDAFSIENGYQSTLQLIRQVDRPTALFALNNLIGLGVLKALQEQSLSIPQDISVIVFDDQPYASFLNPPLTTIKQDIETIGQLAINFIIQTLRLEPVQPTVQLIPTEMIIRKSVRRL
jgi:LacI family transcriptional regulator